MTALKLSCSARILICSHVWRTVGIASKGLEATALDTWHPAQRHSKL